MAKAGDAFVDIYGNFAPLNKQIAGMASGRIGKSMTNIGKTLTRSLTLPMVAVGGMAVKMSLDFQRSMQMISTQAGGSAREVKALSTEVLNLSKSSEFGPKALADALFHIESVGYRGAAAMRVLNSAQQLATVGNADLESTTNALVGAMRTGIKGASDMHETIGTLNATIGAGNLRMEDLTAAMGTGFLVSAKQVSLSLRDAGAALAELTSQGVPASAAATRLRMTFTLMAAPTEKAIKALKSVGIDSEAMAKQMQKPDGLVRALSLLKEHLHGLSKIEQTQLLSEAFGGARSGTTIMALVGNLGDLNKKYVEIGKNAGDFHQKLKETDEQPLVKLQKAWNQIQVVMIELGSALIPVIVPAFEKIASIVGSLAHGFEKLPASTKALIGDAVAFAAALGPVLWIGGKLLTTYAKLKVIVMAASEAFSAMRVAAAATAVTSASTGVLASGGQEVFANTAASRAAAGASGTGVQMAKTMAGGLAKTIGPAVAAYGIGNIVSSALSGDWRDAGFEAGGAIAGGIAGFMLGGPLGAMLGVGLGSLGGELFSSLFSSSKKVTRAQARIVESAHAVAAALANEKHSGQILGLQQQHLHDINDRVHKSSQRLAQAEEHLAAVRQRHGRDSLAALGAEQRVYRIFERQARAIGDKRKALEWLHFAEHTHFKDIGATANASAVAMHVEQRHLQHLKLLQQTEGSTPELRAKIVSSLKRLSGYTSDYSQAIHLATQHNKAWGHSLEEMTTAQHRFGAGGRALGRMLSDQREKVKSLREAISLGGGLYAQADLSRAEAKLHRMEGTMKQVSSSIVSHMSMSERLTTAAVAALARNVTLSTSAMDKATGIALRDVVAQAISAARRLGIGPAHFSVAKGKGKQRGGRIGFQVGGFTVPGTATGDVFETALPFGSFVMNKKAAAAYGFQAGGLTPVSLEPRERVFLPPEVQRLGAHNLEAMNRAVPRFQHGGEVNSGIKPPQIIGSDPLRAMGQAAVNKLFQAAVKLLQAAGGHRTFQAVLKEANRIDALKLPYVWGGGHQSSPAPPNGPFDCSGAVSALMQGAGFRIPTMVSSGFEGFGEAGRGKVSVLANPEHVYTVIGNRAWGTSAENPGGGAGWISGYTYRPGFTVRHADIASLGTAMSGHAGKGQAAKKGFARGGFIKKLVGASTYGGPGDPSSETTGSSGVSLPGKMAFAELDMGKALGGLPYHFKLRVSSGGHSVIAEKLDIGAGGGPVGGHARDIDLWYQTAAAIGLPASWLGVVQLDEAGSSPTGKTKIPSKVHGSFAKHKPGQTGHGGGTYGSPVMGKYTAQTSELKFGPLPKSEDGCLKELYHLEKVLLPEYRAAAKGHPDKKTAAALLKNQKAIEKRALEVRKQLRTLRIGAAKKRLAKKLGRAMARITGWEGAIETAQRAYEAASQYAEQVVSAEPLEGGSASKSWVESVLAPYITGQEEPAYMEVLGTEAGWRNKIIEAQTAVGGQENTWVGNIGALGSRIGDIGGEIDKDNRRIAQLRDLIKNQPKSKDRPKWEAERDQLVGALPALHQRLQAARERRKQITEALTETKTSWDPWKGTGSFEDSLVQVQGIHWPAQHELLAALPAMNVPGSFGGAIWDTQSTIQELGLKIKQALESAGGGEGEGGSSEKSQLLEQLLKEERERLAISQAQYKVFQGFKAVPNFGGSFAAGGIVPGPAGEPRLTITHGREGVFTPEQMAAMGATGGGHHETNVIIEEGAGVDPEKIRAETRKVLNERERTTSRGVSRRIPARAGVFGGR